MNGASFGNFSLVNTELTNNTGTVGSGFQLGFPDDSNPSVVPALPATGFFSSTDAAVLASLYSSLSSTGTATYTLNDVDPFDNFYDFTEGVSANLINTGQGPIVAPPVTAVPGPIAGAGLVPLLGLAGAWLVRRRKQLAA